MCLCATIALLPNGEARAQEPGDGRRDPLFRWMLGSYVGLQAADLYLTRRGTAMGLEEANPAFGTEGSVAAAKAALVPLTTWGLARLHRTRPRLASGLAIGLNVVYAGVVAHNARVISESE